MRILSKHVHFKSSTFVVRVALEQDTDDAWNLFNLINHGDLIKGSAYRKVRWGCFRSRGGPV